MDAILLYEQFRSIFSDACKQAIKAGLGDKVQLVRCFQSFEEFDREFPTLRDKAKLVAEVEDTVSECDLGIRDAIALLEEKGLVTYSGEGGIVLNLKEPESETPRGLLDIEPGF